MPNRRLIIMRHASAAGGGSGSDHARPLTRIGNAEAARVGIRLAQLGALPDRVLSSSATRCRETFESLCIGMKIHPPVDFEDALYNAAHDELLDQLASWFAAGENPGTLLLLAHNPGVSMLAFDLGQGESGDETSLRSGFAPATFAVFEIEDDGPGISRRTARLQHFERPA